MIESKGLKGIHVDEHVLDHGYVRLVETWGAGDAAVPEAGMVEAARQSTQGNFRGWEKDAKLLRYLFTAKPPHASPFEFAGMVIEVQAPIFVFREWQRHRTQSYNEMSARYSPLPDLNYLPSVERVVEGSKTTANKQAGAMKKAPEITLFDAQRFRNELAASYTRFEEEYQAALRIGVPKEVARCGMPVGRYSRMRASANLRNWLAFLTLRMDPMAQWEIRQFANAVGTIVEHSFPQTWALFAEVRERAAHDAESSKLRDAAHENLQGVNPVPPLGGCVRCGFDKNDHSVISPGMGKAGCDEWTKP